MPAVPVEASKITQELKVKSVSEYITDWDFSFTALKTLSKYLFNQDSEPYLAIMPHQLLRHEWHGYNHLKLQNCLTGE